MPASGRDEDIFDDPRHMSCEDFVFPIDYVGLPSTQQLVSFHNDKEALQDNSKKIGLKNALLDE